MTSSPPISALLCTHNRAALLPEVLQALSAQTLPDDQFEVVIIDDGSEDESREIIHAFANGRRNFRYAYQRNSGLANAKNHGLFLCRAPLVVFLDDDDVASPGLLETHLLAHRRHPKLTDAVLGYTAIAPAIASDPLMHFVSEVEGLLFCYSGLNHGDVLDYRWFWGGRSSCKRALLIEHGIFDPVFRFGCEDVELGYRLSRFGLRVIYDQNARTTMIRRIDFDGFVRRRRLQGESQYVFSQRHLVTEVLDYCHVIEGLAEWRRVEPIAGALIESARRLDAFVRNDSASGFVLDPVTEHLVHIGYRTAFHVANIQGIADQSAAVNADLSRHYARRHGERSGPLETNDVILGSGTHEVVRGAMSGGAESRCRG